MNRLLRFPSRINIFVVIRPPILFF